MAEESIKVFSHDWITVWCEPTEKLVWHQVHHYVFGQVFRDALTAGVQAMEKHRCTKWLSDDRRNGPLPPDELTWADQVWSGQAIKAGWKTWALVLPEEVLGQMNVQRHAKLYRQRGVVVETFTDPAEARKWLSVRE